MVVKLAFEEKNDIQQKKTAHRKPRFAGSALKSTEPEYDMMNASRRQSSKMKRWRMG